MKPLSPAPCPAALNSTPASNRPLSVGIIGLGRAGWDIHVRFLRDDPRFRIAAAADPEVGRREQARVELNCATYATPESMLGEAGLDLVVVASPSMCHKDHALLALASGCHVVVEKPLASHAKEVDAMVDAAQAGGRYLMPYQPRRLTPLHRKFKQVISEGLLGPLTHIAYRRYNYIRRDDWQCVLAYGGGMLSNHGSHVLDQILDLVKSPVARVMCCLDRISSVGDAEDHVTLLMQTDSQVSVHVEISDGVAPAEGGPEWLISGEYGTLTASGHRGTIRRFDPREVPVRWLQTGLAATDRRYGTTEALPWKEEHFSLQDEIDLPYYDSVYTTIAHNAPFIFPAEEVRNVISVLDTCRRQNPSFSHASPAGPQAPTHQERAQVCVSG